MTDSDLRPIVLITGATGNLGRSLGEALGRDYRIVGLDRNAKDADFPVFEADFTSDAAVELALCKFRDAFGSRIASVSSTLSLISTLPGRTTRSTDRSMSAIIHPWSALMPQQNTSSPTTPQDAHERERLANLHPAAWRNPKPAGCYQLVPSWTRYGRSPADAVRPPTAYAHCMLAV